MNIGEAIRLADKLKLNQYPHTMKIKWLSNLDGQIFSEVIASHEDGAIERFEGYNDDTPQSTELLVGYPYDEDIYSFFLQAAIDRENGETGKYNQNITMYNNSFLAYQNWYNRTHLPKAAGARFRF